MSTTRSELSEKNRYRIPKDRYLELKHFCAQIPLWQAKVRAMQESRYANCYEASFKDKYVTTNGVYRQPEIAMPSEEENDLNNRIVIFSEAMRCALPFEYSAYAMLFFQAVTGSASYDRLSALDPLLTIIPREKWYEYYRKFFFLLDKLRH